jgi:2-phosphosulfolactate phosphatase
VIVDVLRFTSAVSAAVESGAEVVPAPWTDEAPDGTSAGTTAGSSLSPAHLLTLRPGIRVVVPSPNGAALALAARGAGARHVLAGCLRNATATAQRATQLADGGPIAVIAAGERWHGADGPLRPAVEDLLGAGAILTALDPAASLGDPRCSPEAAAARDSFAMVRPLVHDALAGSTSGRELIERGAADDVLTSAAYDVAPVAAELVGDAFVAAR